jgi:hypothetical protein
MQEPLSVFCDTRMMRHQRHKMSTRASIGCSGGRPRDGTLPPLSMSSLAPRKRFALINRTPSVQLRQLHAS